ARTASTSTCERVPGGPPRGRWGKSGVCRRLEPRPVRRRETARAYRYAPSHRCPSSMSASPDAPSVVVVTGASAGVGRAVVRAFARRGARIGLVARGEAGLRAAAAEVERLGGRALVLPCDVADAAAVEAAAGAVEAAFGPLDVGSNNAMQSVFS